ncbi:tol-pal system protein YbgF [Marivivens sp. LCG002]|uniref:tol-pal system protein YbgF n=1 Tax=Marivivens sp. LCG002 TaxID=3051171 RepID=UPI00255402FF|nr:tol-pal system protein YbgF [Marivivens sp. LCG002]WIV50318.1 tol-pal system protein YbgF [Marivivens sp. LCG002]
MFRRLAFAVAIALSSPLAASAQQTETLADIRQQLSSLYVDVQNLRSELSASGGLTATTGSGSTLDRLNAIEAELQRLTAKSEELEFRINRITEDGTRRITDLEFRLCELEEGCDLSLVGTGTTLGGVDSAASIPAPQEQSASTPELAVGEEADFAAAEAALSEGDFETAVQLFATFVESYPGGPLNAQAHYLRGEALESLGNMTDAARAYLASFSVDQSGEIAPDALFKLGYSLGTIGQVQDACITLAEVVSRFPDLEAAADAKAAMQSLSCG